LLAVFGIFTLFTACKQPTDRDNTTKSALVNQLDLTGLVTAPVKGAAPVTTAINATQYTGEIAWKTSTGAAHSGSFTASAVYKAEVTLTPKTGFTFTGITANTLFYGGKDRKGVL
jgi:hypothetical protein